MMEAVELLPFGLLPAESTMSRFLLPAAMLLIVLVLLRRAARKRRRGKTGSGPLARVAPLAPLGGNAPRPAELDRWSVEMHDLVRDTTAEIDTKQAALRQMLRMADQRIERLTSLIERCEALPAGDREPQAPAPAAPAAREAVSDDRETRIAALAAAGYSEVHIAHQVGATLPEVRQFLAGG